MEIILSAIRMAARTPRGAPGCLYPDRRLEKQLVDLSSPTASPATAATIPGRGPSGQEPDAGGVEELCSVGRRAEREIREVETGYDDAADQAGLVALRPGTLPVPGWHQELRALAGVDVGAEKMSRRALLVGADLENQGAAAVVEPQFGAAHGVPRRLLTGQQKEEDRWARVPGPGVVRR